MRGRGVLNNFARVLVDDLYTSETALPPTVFQYLVTAGQLTIDMLPCNYSRRFSNLQAFLIGQNVSDDFFLSKYDVKVM